MPNPSFILPLFLESALLPFALALMVLLLARRAGLADWGPLLAVAAGFLASYIAVYHAQWSFQPHQSLDWLPWIVLFGVAGVVGVEKTAHPLLRHAVRLVLCVACVTLVVWPAVASGGLPSPVLSIAIAGLLMFAAWTYLGTTVSQRPTPAFMLVVVAGGAALALMLDSSQVIGQLSGALATTLIAGLVFNLLRGPSGFSGAATGLVVILLGTLLVNAHVYAGFSLGYVLLLLAGLLADPLVAGFNRLRQRSGGRSSWVTAGVLTAIPVLTTIGLAIRAMQETGGY